MSTPAQDTFPVIGMDAVVFAVGNAKQAAHYYSTAFGMRRIAYRGPETGSPDEVAHVLESGRVRFVFRGPARAGTPLGQRVAAHGDGVTDLALEVSSAEDAYDYAVSHGAQGLEAPRLLEDDHGKVVVAAIATYGDTRHTLVERSGYSGAYLPGYVPAPPIVAPGEGAFFTEIDIAWAMWSLAGWMSGWTSPPGHGRHEHEGVRRRRHRDRVLRADEQGRRGRKPQGEVPAERARGRQAQVADRRVSGVLRGPGVQHLALATDDIVASVRAMTAAGVAFLATPGSYYDELGSWVGDTRVPTGELRELGTWPTGTRTATCCRSSPSRSRTGPPCSSS